MKVVHWCLAGLVVMGLSACSTTPTTGGDEAAVTDRREGSGLLDQPGSRAGLGVEVLPAQDNQALQGQVISEGGALSSTTLEAELPTFSPVIYFGYDQFSIDEASTETLRYYANQMLDNPRLSVTLEGHTDERGSPSYNLALGEKRSQAAAEVMMVFGVAKERITLISFGEEQPVDMGHDEPAWAKNRRVELRFE